MSTELTLFASQKGENVDNQTFSDLNFFLNNDSKYIMLIGEIDERIKSKFTHTEHPIVTLFQ